MLVSLFSPLYLADADQTVALIVRVQDSQVRPSELICKDGEIKPGVKIRRNSLRGNLTNILPGAERSELDILPVYLNKEV